MLETTSGDLLQFLQKYEESTEKHASHRHLVSTERTASIAYDQNVRRLMITRNQDFAENGSIKNKRQVQSQYWITISYTLFISCVTWVRASEWNKDSGKLKVDTEVTAYGEKVGKPINLSSYWGTVTAILNEEGEDYEVTDKDGIKHRHHRRDLRHRKNHNLIFGHVSDDKSHDSYSMQHFTTNEPRELEQYMVENFPEDLSSSKIECLHKNRTMQPHIKKAENK